MVMLHMLYRREKGAGKEHLLDIQQRVSWLYDIVLTRTVCCMLSTHEMKYSLNIRLISEKISPVNVVIYCFIAYRISKFLSVHCSIYALFLCYSSIPWNNSTVTYTLVYSIKESCISVCLYIHILVRWRRSFSKIDNLRLMLAEFTAISMTFWKVKSYISCNVCNVIRYFPDCYNEFAT